MPPRRVVYTVLMGGYESLVEQPLGGVQGTDLICFTDSVHLTSGTWHVRRVEPVFPADPNRSSRRPKILAHEYLADYDESLYIDNTVLLTAPADVVFDQLLSATSPMALVRHSERASLREEFAKVVENGLDAEWIVTEQLADYERTASQVLDGPTLWGGILARRHNEPSIRNAMQTWWEHVLRYSRRDQLSLPVALEAAGLDLLVHNLDNRRSTFHTWPDKSANRDRSRGAPLPKAPKLIAALENELAMRRSSASWRVTSPMRRMAAFVRGFPRWRRLTASTAVRRAGSRRRRSPTPTRRRRRS